MNEGMLPRRSIWVCIFTAALVVRKCAHGNAQRKIDGRRVERIDRVGEINPEILISVKLAGRCNQRICKIMIDAPIALFVGIRQRAARHIAADAKVIELAGMSAKTDFDIAQAVAKGQLRKGHAQELIEMGECLGGIVRWISLDTPPKRVQRKKVHHLGECQLAGEHGANPGLKTPFSQIQVQVGDTPTNPVPSSLSVPYARRPSKLPDGSGCRARKACGSSGAGRWAG